MIRITFMILSLIILVITLAITTLWPMAAWGLLVILPAIILSIYDMLQSY